MIHILLMMFPYINRDIHYMSSADSKQLFSNNMVSPWKSIVLIGLLMITIILTLIDYEQIVGSYRLHVLHNI